MGGSSILEVPSGDVALTRMPAIADVHIFMVAMMISVTLLVLVGVEYRWEWT